MAIKTNSIPLLNNLTEPQIVAGVLGVTVGTLQVWRSTGRYKLSYVKVGGRVMYRAEDVQAFIESRLHNHTGNAV